MKKKRNGNKIALSVILWLITVMLCLQPASASRFETEITQTNEKTVTLNVVNRPLTYILTEIKNQTGLEYGFRDERNRTADELFSINVRNVTAASALRTLLQNSNYTFEIKDNVILIMNRNSQPARKERDG